MVYEKRDRSCAENFNIFSLLIHEDADIYIGILECHGEFRQRSFQIIC